jgi:hypothetical protein
MAVRAAVAMAHPITPMEALELPILAAAVGQEMATLVEQLETEKLAVRASSSSKCHQLLMLHSQAA